jgi:hypothetical protein
LILLASIGILISEGRLSNSGFKKWIEAMLCPGPASESRKAAAQRYPMYKLGRKEESVWLLGFGLTFGAIGIIFVWLDKICVLSELRIISLWLLLPLAMHVFATTITLLLGRSTILLVEVTVFNVYAPVR